MYFDYYRKDNNFFINPYATSAVKHENFIGALQQPAAEVSKPTVPAFETGILTVKVVSESGLPVEGALVTVYHFHPDGVLEVHYNSRTDKEGTVPDIELLVVYSAILENAEYYYSIYNLRVTADNYSPVNILNFQVYPKVKTNYTVRLVPTSENGTAETPERTIVIPPNPRD